MMMKILLATSNLNKLKNIQDLFHDYPIHFLSFQDIPDPMPAHKETHNNVVIDAKNSALWYYAHLDVKLPVLTLIDSKGIYGVGLCTGKRLVGGRATADKKPKNNNPLFTNRQLKEAIIELILKTLKS